MKRAVETDSCWWDALGPSRGPNCRALSERLNGSLWRRSVGHSVVVHILDFVRDDVRAISRPRRRGGWMMSTGEQRQQQQHRRLSTVRRSGSLPPTVTSSLLGRPRSVLNRESGSAGKRRRFPFHRRTVLGLPLSVRRPRTEAAVLCRVLCSKDEYAEVDRRVEPLEIDHTYYKVSSDANKRKIFLGEVRHCVHGRVFQKLSTLFWLETDQPRRCVSWSQCPLSTVLFLPSKRKGLFMFVMAYSHARIRGYNAMYG